MGTLAKAHIPCKLKGLKDNKKKLEFENEHLATGENG